MLGLSLQHVDLGVGQLVDRNDGADSLAPHVCQSDSLFPEWKSTVTSGAHRFRFPRKVLLQIGFNKIRRHVLKSIAAHRLVQCSSQRDLPCRKSHLMSLLGAVGACVAFDASKGAAESVDAANVARMRDYLRSRNLLVCYGPKEEVKGVWRSA